MGNSAGLNLAILGCVKRKESLLTSNFAEVKILRKCLGVVLSAVFSCICSDSFFFYHLCGEPKFRALNR